MPRFNFSHMPDADMNTILRGLRLLDPQVQLTGKVGTHTNQIRGTYPVAEFIARKGIEDDIYMARLSPCWEGPEEATDLLAYLDDVFRGPIGAQVRRLNRAWMGARATPGAGFKDALQDAITSESGGQIVADPWNPDRTRRYQAVPKEAMDAFIADLRTSMLESQKAAEAAADAVWKDTQRLPRPWEPAFEAAAEDLSPRAREIFASLTCYHVDANELLADVRDLDDGRMLVVVAPAANPGWDNPLRERLLEVLFPEEDGAGTFGKAVLAEPNEIDGFLLQRGFVKGTLAELLDQAEAVIRAEEASA